MSSKESVLERVVGKGEDVGLVDGPGSLRNQRRLEVRQNKFLEYGWVQGHKGLRTGGTEDDGR